MAEVVTFNGGPWAGHTEMLSQHYERIMLFWKDTGAEAGFYEHDASNNQYFFHQIGDRVAERSNGNDLRQNDSNR